jgi:hypothetical protein
LPSAADELKTVKIFFPPLNFGWTAGYELIEVANAQGYFTKYGLDAQLAIVPWDQYTVASTAVRLILRRSPTMPISSTPSIRG